MTPELKSLCDRLQVLSGYLAAADEEEAFPIVDEAAAKLREMAGEIERLREALEPFAREADTWWDKIAESARPWIAEPGNVGGGNAEFSIGDLRRARAALGGSHG